MKFEFKKIPTSNTDQTEITYSCEAEGLQELISEFKFFLLSVGYVEKSIEEVLNLEH